MKTKRSRKRWEKPSQYKAIVGERISGRQKRKGFSKKASKKYLAEKEITTAKSR